MSTSYYGTVVYGTDVYGRNLAIDVPRVLTYHFNENSGVYTFYWVFDQDYITPDLNNVGWRLDISSDDAFTVGNTTSYYDTKGTRVQPNGTETNELYYGVLSLTNATMLLDAPYAGTTKSVTFYKTKYPTNPFDAVISLATATFTNGSTSVSGSGFLAESIAPLDVSKNEALFFHGTGPIRGYDIQVSPREYNNEQTLYARVTTVMGTNLSDTGPTTAFTVYEDYSEKYAESLLDLLPDDHVYSKDALILPIAERNSNLFNICRMYGARFDFLKLSTIKANLDMSIEIGRDEALFDNFGSYFDYPRPVSMDYLQYRLTLKALYESIFYFGSDYAIQRIVASFTGVYPTIIPIRTIANFVVYDAEDGRIGSPIHDDVDNPTLPVIYNRNSMAYGIRIQVNNPGLIYFDIDLLRYILNKAIPMHIYWELI